MPVGGQPRRGREGVLLLPRLHADALVHEVALQVPAARSTLRAAHRGEPAARRAAARSSSCSTPASSTTTATSTSSSSTRRRRPRTWPSASRVHNRGPGGGAAARAAAPLVPQHLGLGRAAATPEPIDPRGRAGAGLRSLLADDTHGRAAAQPALRLPARPAPPVRARPAASCSSPTTRPTRQRVSAPDARSRKPYVKDAFHRHVVDGEDGA